MMSDNRPNNACDSIASTKRGCANSGEKLLACSDSCRVRSKSASEAADERFQLVIDEDALLELASDEEGGGEITCIELFAA